MLFYVCFVAVLSKFGYQRQSIREARAKRRSNGGGSCGAGRRLQGSTGTDETHEHRAVAATESIDEEAAQVNDDAWPGAA